MASSQRFGEEPDGWNRCFKIKGCAVPCGRLCGVKIRVHLLLPMVSLLSGLSAFLAGSGWLGVILAILVTGPLTIITVLVHEFGHVLSARRCGCGADNILLWPLGGLASIGGGILTPKQQIFVSFMGPATHLPMVAFWIGILAAANGGRVTLSTYGMWLETHFFALVCIAMVITNIAMFLFNLFVPCFPLDCSQILVSALLLCGYEPNTVALVIAVVSIPIIIVLLGIGIWTYIGGVATASITIALAIWLAVQTYQLHAARQAGQLHLYPLFSSAYRDTAQAQASSGVSGSGPSKQSGFKAFSGSGNKLGSSTIGNPNTQSVCLASLLAFSIALAVIPSGSPP